MRPEGHVDGTLNALIEASMEQDSARRAEWHKIAQINALTNLTDAVQEAAAVLKEITGRQIDATQDLERTLKKATNAVVIELRRNMRDVA